MAIKLKTQTKNLENFGKNRRNRISMSKIF